MSHPRVLLLGLIPGFAIALLVVLLSRNHLVIALCVGLAASILSILFLDARSRRLKRRGKTIVAPSPEAREGARVLATIPPYSAAPAKPQKAAGPLASALIEHLLRTPRQELNEFLDRADLIAHVAPLNERRAKFDQIGRVTESIQSFTALANRQKLHADIAVWISAKHSEYDGQVDAGYAEALEAVKEIRDKFYPE